MTKQIAIAFTLIYIAGMIGAFLFAKLLEKEIEKDIRRNKK